MVDAGAEAVRDGEATGFMFGPATPAALAHALRQAVGAWREPALWRQLMRRGMAQNFSWEAAAAQYMTLYQSTVAASVIGAHV